MNNHGSPETAVDWKRLEALERFNASGIGIGIRQGVEHCSRETLISLIMLLNMEHIRRDEIVDQILEPFPKLREQLDRLMHEENLENTLSERVRKENDADKS